MTLQGFPTAMLFGGIFFVTTLPVQIVEPSPISTPGRIITPPPSQQSLPILIGLALPIPVFLFFGSTGWIALYICTFGPIQQLSPISTLAQDKIEQLKLIKIFSPIVIFSP